MTPSAQSSSAPASLERCSRSRRGAELLRALGVNGHEAELRNASDEFRGHCLALTLLGSYLADAYNGDIRCREEVSARLVNDVRQTRLSSSSWDPERQHRAEVFPSLVRA